MKIGKPGYDPFTLADLMAVIASFAIAMGAWLPISTVSSDSKWTLDEIVLLVVLSLVWGVLLAGPMLYGLRRLRPNAAKLTDGEALWIANAIGFWVPLVGATVLRSALVTRHHPLLEWLAILWVLGLLPLLQGVTLVATCVLLPQSLRSEPDPRTCGSRNRLGLLVCAGLLILDALVLILLVVVFAGPRGRL